MCLRSSHSQMPELLGCSRCPVPHSCISARRHCRLHMSACTKAPGRLEEGEDNRLVRSRYSQKEASRQRLSTKCIFLSQFFLAWRHSLEISQTRIQMVSINRPN